MDFEVTLALGLIVGLGIGAQWLGRTIKFPSIVLLLAAGVLVGPVAGLVDPEELFGDLLNPAVTLAVGLILFESGFSLDLREIGDGRGVVVRLVTLGVLVTLTLATLASYLFLDVDVQTALLLGAILVVSGPTVVLPILRETRVREPTNAILRWEGIVIDPIGAALGLMILHIVTADAPHLLAQTTGLLATVVVGVVCGLAGAVLLVLALRWYLVPEDLQVAAAVALAVAVFVAAEAILGEAGLFATTAFGIALRNQQLAVVTRIRVFGEDMSALILGSLFIVLAAGVTKSEFQGVVTGSLLLTAVLVLVVRPLAALASTARTSLPWKDRGFVASLAPRGIVAAATSSVYALTLSAEGFGDASVIPAATFIVIVVAGTFYGLSARPIAKALGVGAPVPRGIAIVSSEPWAQTLASGLHALGTPVLLVATDREHLEDGPGIRYPVYCGYVGSQEFEEVLEKSDIGAALVVSANPEQSSIATSVLMELLGRKAVYHLPPEGGHADRHLAELWDGTPDMHKAFDPAITTDELRRVLNEPSGLRTLMWEDGNWREDGDTETDSLRELTPLFLVPPDGRAKVVTGSELRRIERRPGLVEQGSRLLAVRTCAAPAVRDVEQ